LGRLGRACSFLDQEQLSRSSYSQPEAALPQQSEIFLQILLFRCISAILSRFLRLLKRRLRSHSWREEPSRQVSQTCIARTHKLAEYQMATIWRHTNERFVATLVQALGDANIGPGRNRVLAFRDGNRPCHVLLTGADLSVLVNGTRVVGGIRVLQHKDELLVDSERMFFSAESAPIVEVYMHDNSRRRPRCPTCRAEVLDGQPIVRCPGCSRIYHQIDGIDDLPAKPCWTYSPKCRFCQHPSSMSGAPTWQPDEQDA
jgi:hypothetical protein